MTKEKYHFIYRTVCTVTNKWYVGMHITENLNDSYFGSGRLLKDSVSEHGIDTHQREILEFCVDRNHLLIRESEIVNAALLTDEKCLNLRRGGTGGWEHALSKASCTEAVAKRRKTYADRKCQQGMKNSQYGVKRIGIHKDDVIKKILPSEIETFLAHGWKLGFKDHVEKPKKIKSVKIVEESLPKFKEKKSCEKCGVEFIPYRSSRKYCSSSCSAKK